MSQNETIGEENVPQPTLNTRERASGPNFLVRTGRALFVFLFNTLAVCLVVIGLVSVGLTVWFLFSDSKGNMHAFDSSYDLTNVKPNPIFSVLARLIWAIVNMPDDRDGRYYIPSIADDEAFFLRVGHIPKVVNVSLSDVMYGSEFNRLYSAMKTYQKLTKRTCMAMHHMDGYSAEAKNVIGIMLDKYYIRAMNVSIRGHSEHIIETEYDPTLCPSHVAHIFGYDVIYIDYIEYTENYYSGYPAKLTVQKSGGMKMTLRLEGVASACVQQALKEMNGESLCPPTNKSK